MKFKFFIEFEKEFYNEEDADDDLEALTDIIWSECVSNLHYNKIKLNEEQKHE